MNWHTRLLLLMHSVLVNFLLFLMLGVLPGFRGPREGADAGIRCRSLRPAQLPAGELRFEETRDIVAVEVTLDGPAPVNPGLSYLGRAIPRAWFAQDRPIGVENVRTRWGQASVIYLPAKASDTIRARVDLKLANRPPRIRIRFRHPENKPIVGVTINGHEHLASDAGKQDVDLAGLDGPLEIVVRF